MATCARCRTLKLTEAPCSQCGGRENAPEAHGDRAHMLVTRGDEVLFDGYVDPVHDDGKVSFPLPSSVKVSHGDDPLRVRTVWHGHVSDLTLDSHARVVYGAAG